jgi:hypothetical protein
MTAAEFAAIAGAFLIGVVVVFQAALALGAPWGAAAWGGQHPGRLPARLRAASGLSALILILAGWILVAAAGWVEQAPLPQSWLKPATWLLTGYFALGALLNLASRSRVERIWAPVSLIMAACCAVVAAGLP